MLQNADLVIWIGEDLESFLPTALKSIPKDAVVFELLDQSGLKKLKFTGKARCFDNEEDAFASVKNKKFNNLKLLAIWYLGR